MPPQLTVVVGELSGHTFPLVDGHSFRVGRAIDCDLCLHDPHVSRLHCQISVEGEAVRLVDLHSTSGTYIGGARISARYLNDGDVIVVGATKIQYCANIPPQPPASPGPTRLAVGMHAPPIKHALTGGRLVGQTFRQFQVLELLKDAPQYSVYRVSAAEGRQRLLRLFTGPGEQLAQLAQQLFPRFVAIRSCRHPANIVVDQFCLEDEYCWLTETWYSGGGKRRNVIYPPVQPLGPDEVLEMGRQVSEAMRELHERGIFHGQLNPRRVFQRSSGQWVLTGTTVDRRAIWEWHHGAAALNHDVDQLHYRAPECWATECWATDVVPAGRADDVYGLGATMFALLTGAPPRQAQAAGDRSPQQTDDAGYRQKLFESCGAGPALRNLLEQMLAHSPEERLPDMQQVGRWLSELTSLDPASKNR